MSNYDIEVCVDCVMMFANDECEGLDTDSWYHNVKAKGMHRFDVALNCDDDCEGFFSKYPCDYCGSRLAGDRHPAVVFN